MQLARKTGQLQINDETMNRLELIFGNPNHSGLVSVLQQIAFEFSGSYINDKAECCIVIHELLLPESSKLIWIQIYERLLKQYAEGKISAEQYVETTKSHIVDRPSDWFTSTGEWAEAE